MKIALYISTLATVLLLIYLHLWLVLAIGGSILGWKFWQTREECDNYVVGEIRRIENKELHNFLQVKKEYTNTRGFDIIDDVISKANRNILAVGGARTGKTTIGELLSLKIPEKKIIIIFKRFQPSKRDFDIGYTWIDVSQALPNIFSDAQSFLEAFRTAFFADLSSKGLMIDTILSRVGDVIVQHPTDFEDFFRMLDNVATRGQWEESIKTIIKSKVQLLQRATGGARHGKIDFSKGNIVLDLGNISDEEVKTFLAEYWLREINRIEEQEQREEKIYLVIDEAWHLLRYRQQKSIVGTILLQGAYYIHFLCITQNYTHLDEDYRAHFGTILCFRDNNDADSKAIENGYGAFVRDGVKSLSDYEYIDLKYEHKEELIPVHKLNYEKLQTLKLEERAKRVIYGHDEIFVEEQQQKHVDIQKQDTENLSEKIIEALQGETCLYGYEIGKACGLSAKEAVRIRQHLRQLANDKKIKEIKIQIRNKEVVYYYLPESEQVHNLMMQKTEKEIIKTGWKIIFKAIHGVGGADFIIEKDGKKIAIEVETGLKKQTVDLQKRIAEMQTVIIVPNATEKEFYEQVCECRVCLIPEIEEVLKSWQ